MENKTQNQLKTYTNISTQHGKEIINPINKIICEINSKSVFIIENGFNTCYISSLLMAIFYKSSYLDSMLHTTPKNIEMIYLQEIIKTKFVDRVRSGTSILMEIMNEIRTFSNVCGWLTLDELLEQQNVNEYFTFLSDCVQLPPIELQKINTTKYFGSILDTGEIKSVPFISLLVPEDIDEVSIKTLLSDLTNYIIFDKNEKEKELYIYKIMNIPYSIGISLNRFDNQYNKRIITKINIQKKIKLPNINDEGGLKWSIHSIICHTGDTLKSGHYYAVIFSSDNKWFIFDDHEIPSLNEVNIKNTDIMNKIKSECVFLIYIYDDVNMS